MRIYVHRRGGNREERHVLMLLPWHLGQISNLLGPRFATLVKHWCCKCTLSIGAVSVPSADRERSSTPFTEDEVEDAEARKTIADCKLRIAKAEQVKHIEDKEYIIITIVISVISHSPIIQKQEVATMREKSERLESESLECRRTAEEAETSAKEIKLERRGMQREVLSTKHTTRIKLIFPFLCSHKLSKTGGRESYVIHVNTKYSQIRDAAGRVEELEASNRHLEIRLAKAKTAIPTC